MKELQDKLAAMRGLWNTMSNWWRFNMVGYIGEVVRASTSMERFFKSRSGATNDRLPSTWKKMQSESTSIFSANKN